MTETGGGRPAASNDTRSPINAALDAIEWEPIPDNRDPATEEYESMPHATHKGVLRIGNAALTVYRLSTGDRVFDEEDVIRFFVAVGEPQGEIHTILQENDVE